MALLRYFSPSLPKKVSSLTEKEVKEVNAGVTQAQEEAETVASGHGMYNAYTVQEKAKIGKYAAELYATVLNSGSRLQSVQMRGIFFQVLGVFAI